MGREQMRNLDTSRIGGGQVNEFEYQKNQGELTEQLEQHPIGGQPVAPLTQAERVKQVMAAAHKKVEKRKKKEAALTGKKKTAAPAGKNKTTVTAKKREAATTGKKKAGVKSTPKPAKKVARKTPRKK
jgi:hypothetical protein